MNRIQILQKLIEDFAVISYHGVFLWKYIEYEMTSGIIGAYQSRSVGIVGTFKDWIPEARQETIENTKSLLEELTEKEILFGTLPIRRPYNGKLEHTAFDPYAQAIEDDKYVVIEPNNGGQGDEIIVTKNRKRYLPLGVIGLYGQDIVDKNELIEFLIVNYARPLEKAYNIVLPKETMVGCVFKLSSILKQRRAFLAFFQDVLKRVNPKVICYTYGADYNICFLREAAQGLNIPAIEIEHGGGLVRQLEYSPNLSYYDYFLSDSDLLTDKMRDLGLKRVYTVGKPFVYENKKCILKNEHRPIVISFISSLEKELFEMATEMAKRLDKDKYVIAFKTHNSECWQESEQNEISKQFSNFNFIESAADVRDVYAISDIVVGVRSGGILDALPYQNIKVLVLRDKYRDKLLVGNYDFYDDLDELGDVQKVIDKEELYQEIMNYQRGIAYRGAVNHYWPEDADVRFRSFIQIFLDGNRPPEDKFFLSTNQKEY